MPVEDWRGNLSTLFSPGENPSIPLRLRFTPLSVLRVLRKFTGSRKEVPLQKDFCFYIIGKVI